MIKDKHMPALQGMFPSWITSCTSDGEPNTTVISQIWYVDEKHVALSFQFFNKTKKVPLSYIVLKDNLNSQLKYEIEKLKITKV